MHKSQSQQLSEKRKEQLQHCEFLAASIPPETLSAENRTVDCVWFTGADVARYDFWNDEIYIRRFDPKGVDLAFLNSGAPVLDNHSMCDGSSSQKGKVEKAWIDQKDYKATLRFSRRPEVDGLWQDIQDKIVTKFSMGTEILEEKKFTEDDGKGNQVKVRLATNWRPFEISVLPLPADFGTTTLAAEVAASAQFNRATAPEGEDKLEKEKIPGSDAPKQIELAATQVVTINAEAERATGVTAERLRTSEIRKIAQAVRLDEAFINQHVEAGTSIEVFRKAALDKLADRDAALPATRSGNISITREEADTRREAMTASLLHRADPAKYKLEEPAREYVGLSLIELAKECMQASGVNPRGLSRMKVAELAFQSTSDFPLILAASANKFLRTGYDLVPSLWRQIAAPRSAPDFKLMRDLQFDSNARLEKVNEHGEFHRGSLVESQDTWQLATYGKVISITRQAIINDDLSAFTRVPMLMGQEVALLEADLVWGVITANAALADGVALFHATHANLVGGTVINVDNLGTVRKSIRLQTSIGGKTLNLQPKYLVVPVALEQLAMQYTSPNFQPTAQSGINPWIGSLTPIAEARLDANSTIAWYLFCDPGLAPVVIYAYLQGNEGPFTETRLGFEVDGTEFKVRQDFGVGAIDYRGAAKNPGDD